MFIDKESHNILIEFSARFVKLSKSVQLLKGIKDKEKLNSIIEKVNHNNFDFLKVDKSNIERVVSQIDNQELAVKYMLKIKEINSKLGFIFSAHKFSRMNEAFKEHYSKKIKEVSGSIEYIDDTEIRSILERLLKL